jgi:hypothetical protein
MFKLPPNSPIPSLVNAIICLFGTIPWSTCHSLKYFDPENNPPFVLEVVSSSFVGYLQWDLLLNMWYYKQLRNWPGILHHSVYLVCKYIVRANGYFYNAAWWLFAGEISTVLLKIREMTKRGSRLNNISTALFVPTFIATRVILYGWGLNDLLTHSEEWSHKPSARVVFGTFSLAYLLNLYWASLIIKKVARLIFKNGPSRATLKDSE